MPEATHEDILDAIREVKHDLALHSAKEVPLMTRLQESVYGENGLQNEMIRTRTILRVFLAVVGVLGTATVGLLFALLQQALQTTTP